MRGGDIAVAQAMVGDGEAALATAAKVQRAEWRVVVLGGIAREGAKAGDLPSAHGAIGAALAALDEIAGGDERASALARIAAAQADIGDGAESLATARQIANERGRAAELAYIARLLAQRGRADASGEASRDAVAAALDLDETFARAQAVAMVLALLPDE
jgi:hypothetical protein